MWRIAFIAAALVLAGCDPVTLSAPQDASQFAANEFELVRQHKLDLAIAHMEPQNRGPQVSAVFQKMAQVFPSETPQSVQLQTWGQVDSFAKNARYDFVYLYSYSQKAVICKISIDRTPKGLEVVGIQVAPVDLRTNREATTFQLADQPPGHYFILFLAIVLPLFCLFTFVTCLFTPVPRLKWLWAIFVLIGLGGVQFSWMNGGIALNPLSFTLLGAAYTQAPLSPAILTVAIPVGAILFWIRRPTWLSRARPTAQDDRSVGED